MAPEIFSLKPKYSVFSDMYLIYQYKLLHHFLTRRYAFGIILWQIAARQRPYEGAVPAAIEGCIRNGEREELIEGCPQGYMELVQQCWAHDPTARPTIELVVAAILTIKNGVFVFFNILIDA